MNLFNSQKLKCFDSHGPLNWTATYMKNSEVQTAYYGVVPDVYHGGFDPTRIKLPRRENWNGCYSCKRLLVTKKNGVDKEDAAIH